MNLKAWVIHALGGVTAKQRLAWWQWIARIANVQAKVDQEEKDSWFRMGVAFATGKPARLTYRDYPHFLDEQVGVAYARALDRPPSMVPSVVVQSEPPTFNELQASNDAFVRRNQVYGATLDTSHETPIVRLARIKRAERRQG